MLVLCFDDQPTGKDLGLWVMWHYLPQCTAKKLMVMHTQRKTVNLAYFSKESKYTSYFTMSFTRLIRNHLICPIDQRKTCKMSEIE